MLILFSDLCIYVDVRKVSEVSELHAASIIRVKICMMSLVFVYVQGFCPIDRGGWRLVTCPG
jgi:hypothetical protein